MVSLQEEYDRAVREYDQNPLNHLPDWVKVLLWFIAFWGLIFLGYYIGSHNSFEGTYISELHPENSITFTKENYVIKNSGRISEGTYSLTSRDEVLMLGIYGQRRIMYVDRDAVEMTYLTGERGGSIRGLIDEDGNRWIKK